jgi:hypothetical protein
MDGVDSWPGKLGISKEITIFKFRRSSSFEYHYLNFCNFCGDESKNAAPNWPTHSKLSIDDNVRVCCR